jgi:hypothetical protein
MDQKWSLEAFSDKLANLNRERPCGLCIDVFQPLKGYADSFVYNVLIKARENGIVFSGASWSCILELPVFLSGERGVDVFREWLQVPYVCEYMMKEPQVVKLSSPERKWDSCAHALAFLGRHDLLEVLLTQFDHHRHIKVLFSVLAFQGCQIELVSIRFDFRLTRYENLPI